jgi:hypothetical protein
MPKKSLDEKMKRVLVGGPLLGSRQRNLPSDLVSWDQFEPLITPEIALDKRQSQRFILLPHARFISVLAYKTGTQIATLVPFMDGEEEDQENQVIIESVCLAKYPRKLSETTVQDVLDKMDMDDDSDQEMNQFVDEVVVMVGCRDGSIREFSLKCLDMLNDTTPVDCGPYQIAGPCCRPRRVIRVSKKEPIMHLTVPALRNRVHDDGVLIYVVARTKGLEKTSASSGTQSDKSASVNVAVLRVLLPHFDGSADVSLLRKDKEDKQRKWHLDNIKCRVGKDKTGSFMNTAPFRLQSVAKPMANDHSVFVVLARANAIHVYYDQLQSSNRFPPLSFPMPANNPLSAFKISVNNSDIACGHYHGDITVMNGVLDEVEKYHVALSKAEQQFGSGTATLTTAKPEDPRKNFIASKVHWHSHPVASLAYDATSSPMDPILYSGGEETVLVTWQISQGRDRPADVLPRIALGGIVHVACADRIDNNPGNGILVYCEDNSLQLFESHNKGRTWKLQGLACKLKAGGDSSSDMRIEVDPRAQGATDSQIIITGLPEAPGYMHWYDPSRQRLSASLEIAPFNRISRTEHDENPLPAPTVTNHVFSEDGAELITLEETPTENLYIGAYENQGRKGGYGVVSTIRFWSWNDSSATQGALNKVPYTLGAAMTYPHGPKNRVSALAMTKDGSLACTVSNDEKAFRVWHKVVADEEDEARRAPAWTCRYKVTIPAGFSNLLTKKDGVAFSDDGSLIAMCFGNMITLWDSDEARFLTSICHLEGNIDFVKFVGPGRLQDLLLIKSEFGVSLQSPFGSKGSFKGWSWGIPVGMKGTTVSDAEMIDSHACLAITIFNSLSGQSRLVLIDASSGKPGVKDYDTEAMTFASGIEGCITSACAVGKSEKQSSWGNEQTTRSSSLHLYTLTSNGELLLFTTGGKGDLLSTSQWTDVSQSSGPTLDIGRGDERAKRKRIGAETTVLPEVETITKKTAVEIFGYTSSKASKAGAPATAELPSLSRAFVRAFVGRSLSRNQNERTVEE